MGASLSSPGREINVGAAASLYARPVTGADRSARTAAGARVACSLAPLLFAVPVALAIGETALRLAGEPHPYFWDTSGVEIDAHVAGAGAGLYQDPDRGYTGLLYTPLYALSGATLDQVVFWDGWLVLVTMAAVLALVALAARLAYRPTGPGATERGLATMGAIGIALVVWWLVACVPFSFLYSPRPDQLSWALGLGGLLAVPAAMRGSNRHAALAVALLAAAFWTKQTALACTLAAVGWIVVEAVRGRVSARRAVPLGLALGGVHLALLATLELTTGRWGRFLMFELPAGETRVRGLGAGLEPMLAALAPAAALAALTWAAVAIDARGRRRLADSGEHNSRAGILICFLVVAIPLALYFFQKQGTAPNQFVGIAWALGLLAALGFGRARGRPGPAVVVVVCVLAFLGLSESERARAQLADLSIGLVAKRTSGIVEPIPTVLRTRAARGERIYHPVFSGLGVRRSGAAYIGHSNLQDLLAGGGRPGHLARALLDRRFQLVYAFEDGPERSAYASAYGRREADFPWKLNEVIRSRYAPLRPPERALDQARTVPGPLGPYVSPGVFARRPGPEPAPWMRSCFGPFDLGGFAWEIRAGGGFWCRAGRGRLVLRRTRASRSEVQLPDMDVRVVGTFRLTLPRGRGEVALHAGDGWRVTLSAERREVVLERPGTGTARARVDPDAGVSIVLSSATRAPSAPGRRIALPASRGVTVTATRGSEAVLAVGRLEPTER